MRFVRLKEAHGGGDIWVNPELVASVRQHTDNVVNVALQGGFTRQGHGDRHRPRPHRPRLLTPLWV